MSYNANTLYKAVDVDTIAQQCKDAITQKVYVVVNVWGNVEGVYRDRLDAKDAAEKLETDDEYGWYGVETHELI